jgi:hypothetical protein
MRSTLNFTNAQIIRLAIVQIANRDRAQTASGAGYCISAQTALALAQLLLATAIDGIALTSAAAQTVPSQDVVENKGAE